MKISLPVPWTAPLLLILHLGVSGCDDTKPAPKKVSTGRFQAVAAKGPDKNQIEGFCDAATSAPFAKRKFDEPLKDVGGWRWVNLWATWCKPCIEEMPLLRSWAPRLKKDGVPMTLQFVSVDEDLEALAKFRSAHPESKSSAHLADPSALTEWLTELGLDEGAGLPVHLIIDPEDRIRCVRAGGISAHHYDTVKAVFKSGART